MKIALATLLLGLLGCSSTNAGFPADDAGGDTNPACGVVGSEVDCICESGAKGRGGCQANGKVLCSCAPIEDTGTPADTMLTDSGTMTDSASDTGDPIQKGLCESGAPRLAWKDGGCIDSGTADLKFAPFACTFTTASDGRLRCLPSARAAWGAWQDSKCTVPKAVAWTTDPVPDYILVGETVASAKTVIETIATAPFSPWIEKTDSSCVERTTTYPHITPKGLAVFPRATIDIAAFYAAPPV